MPAPSPQVTRRQFLLDVADVRRAGVPEMQADTSWDFETYSDADLKKVGGSRYARHPSTEVLMLSVRTDTTEIQWVPAEGQRCPRQILEWLLDPTTRKKAWNARFELDIFEHVLDHKPDLNEWKCVMVMAASLSLPMDLATAGAVLGLPEESLKIKDGKRLIKKFSVPRKPTKKDARTRWQPEDDPDDWNLYKTYNRGDTRSERGALRRMSKWDMPEHEWDLWRVDQEINNAGIPINRAMVENAIAIYNDVFADRIERMKAITGLENPNSGAQLLPWLKARGYPWDDLKKGHVKRALDNVETYGFDTATVRVLIMRSEISRTSVKKYPALLDALDTDDRLRGCLQFNGAGRTWRWSGRRFQPQNLAKPTKEYEDRIHYATDLVENSTAWAIEQMHDTPIDLLSSCVRSTVQAPPGWELQDADLNAIENRVLGWVADCDKILSVFREGKCPYVSFATYMYHEPYEALFAEYKAGNKAKRTIAKPGVLGCFGSETPVLTDRGWVPIIDVTLADRVHDGVEFVAHTGVVNQGVRAVIDLAGVAVTPEHRILSGENWEEACRVKENPKLLQQALDAASGASSKRNTADGSHGRTGAEARTVYDITNAGPRSRFVIKTNAGPVIVHNCGYMLSGGNEKENRKTGELERTGLWGYAYSMGIDMTQQQANDSVVTFRDTFSEVVELWWALDKAARVVITTGRPQRVGRVVIDKSGPFMRIVLPSGRALHYLRPKLEQKPTPWGEMRWQITYEGKDQITGKWTRINTHPGKITENIVQAIARDLLAHGMMLAHRDHGLSIVLHVHDEIVTLAGATESKETLEVLTACMADQPPWAAGLPLAAEGFTDTLFRKD